MTMLAVAQISKFSRLRRAPGSGESLVQPLVVGVGHPRRVEDRQPAVADLGGQRDVLRPLGAQHDRDVGAQRMGDRLERLAQTGCALACQRQRIVRAVARHRRLAGPHLPDDVDVFAGPGQRLGERLAVPALDHLRAGHAEPEDVPAAAEVVEGQRGHRAGGRRARGQLDDRGAQPQPVRRRTPPGQRRVGVRAPCLGGEHGVESGVLGRGHEFGVVVGRLSAPISQLQSELHAHCLPCRSRPDLESILRTCSTRHCDHQPKQPGADRYPSEAALGASEAVLRLHPFSRPHARSVLHRAARATHRRRPRLGWPGLRPARRIRPGDLRAA